MKIVSATGSITSQDLIKSLTPDAQNPIGARQSAAPKPQGTTQGQPQPRRPEGYGAPAAIYAPFISAITSAISLHLIRSHGALPLGLRTLYTAVERLGYDNPRIDNESPLAMSCLTTLNVQLNPSGTLTVAVQTVSQPGISRLSNPREDIQDVLQVQPGMDLWLCPNGNVARLITANVEPPHVPSPGAPTPENNILKRRQWKLDVAQWLSSFGLSIDSIDDELWVAVEVWEPIFAKIAGDAWRQKEDSQSPLPQKCMLWPARFCFRRPGPSMQASWLQDPAEDPLVFAERWTNEVGALQLNQPTQTTTTLPEPQTKDQSNASPRPENLDGFESLSRMAQYPDLPPTNLVYPTPPEGTATTGLSNPNTDDADLILSPAVALDPKNAFRSETAPNPVGTGRYDASEDEDLFGDMNDRDFGSKGITDADFSFFDDPDFEDMDIETTDHPQEHKEPLETIQTDMAELSGSASETKPPPVIPETSQIPEEAEVQPEPTEQKMPSGSIDDVMDEDHPPRSPASREGQTISPPLSPVEVKKILFSGTEKEEHPDVKDPGSQQGHYLPVAFERKIGDWDQKYGAAGKFWFTYKNKSGQSDQAPNTIPTIGLPHRGRGPSVNHQKAADHIGASAMKESDDESLSDSDSESSDASEYIISEKPTASSIVPSLKRKRVPSESDILSVASPAKSAGLADANTSRKVENETFLGNFLANFSDWTFISYFSAFQSQQLPVLLRREDQVKVAQLLADQVTQSSLNHLLDDRICLFDLESDSLLWQTYLEDSSFLGDIFQLDLKSYISLQEDVSALQSQQSGKESVKSTISRVNAPHLRVRRGKEYLETLPSAVSFWETFGLEPAHGAKDISAYCIHPTSAAKATDEFLSRFGLHYQGCNFGSHARGDKSVGFENGMKSWESETSSYTSMMHGLKTICRELGQLCSTLTIHGISLTSSSD